MKNINKFVSTMTKMENENKISNKSLNKLNKLANDIARVSDKGPKEMYLAGYNEGKIIKKFAEFNDKLISQKSRAFSKKHFQLVKTKELLLHAINKDKSLFSRFKPCPEPYDVKRLDLELRLKGGLDNLHIKHNNLKSNISSYKDELILAKEVIAQKERKANEIGLELVNSADCRGEIESSKYDMSNEIIKSWLYGLDSKINIFNLKIREIHEGIKYDRSVIKACILENSQLNALLDGEDNFLEELNSKLNKDEVNDVKDRVKRLYDFFPDHYSYSVFIDAIDSYQNQVIKYRQLAEKKDMALNKINELNQLTEDKAMNLNSNKNRLEAELNLLNKKIVIDNYKMKKILNNLFSCVIMDKELDKTIELVNSDLVFLKKVKDDDIFNWTIRDNKLTHKNESIAQ